MKRTTLPLILLLAALPAAAQPQGTAVLRAETGGEQPRPGVPDTGVRRIPSPGNPAPPGGVDHGSAPVPADVPGEVAKEGASSKPLSTAEMAALTAAFKAIDESRWSDARAAVANFDNALLKRIVDWHVLRAAPRTDADFASTWSMLRSNPDWPEPELLRRQAEDRIGPSTPPQQVFAYFTAFPPLTSAGQLRRLEAAQVVNPSSVAKFAGDSWRNATFRAADEQEFLNKYGQHLSGDDQIARFDRIMRDGRPQVARDLLPKLPPDYQPLANARLAMATKAADAPTLLKSVPASKLNEPVIKLERLAWLRKNGRLDEAKVLAAQPPAAQNEAWWNERHQLARDLLAAGHAGDAYAVAVQHGQSRGIPFAEAEFLAGWIALRQLKKPVEALKHFQTLYDGAPTDNSRSRGAYWIARALEASGRSKEAMDWFGRGAAFGQTFYGQLAARRAPGGASKLPSDPVAGNADRQAMAERELVTAARYISQAGDAERTRPFLLRLARVVSTPGETLLLSQLATELKRPDIALVIARRATDNGVTLSDALFPVVDLGSTGSVERALALALTRQESGFNVGAVSSSGALGLMQLLPGTASDVAGRLNVPFVQDKLTRDPAYNVSLGTQYLSEMLKRFGGSYELAAAAYNAGPNRVARWLETMGDPRNGKIDMVDWIEMIPFRETRNYVQRIMEGVGVYRDRLNGPFRAVAPAMGRS